MTVSPTVLVLGIAIGAPLMLLAFGVLYHAWVIQQRQHVDLTAHVQGAATESADDLVGELRRAVQDMQGQLVRQRDSLGGMLSDSARVPRGGAAAMAHVAPQTPPLAATIPDLQPADLRGAVRQLVAEGLSDRAIARRLHVGLEEVRLARTRAGSAS